VTSSTAFGGSFFSMAEGKKAFTAYCDWHETFKELTDEEAGKLVKHLFAYVNDESPNAPDRLTDLLFKPMMLALKRDLKKYEKVLERNKINGAKGGRPSLTQDNPKNPVGLSGINEKPKKADRDKDTDRDTDIDINPKKDLEERKKAFATQIAPFISTDFQREDAKEFYLYWTEHGPNDKKMRYEKEKSFGIGRRIATWVKRKKDFAAEKKKDGKQSIDQIHHEMIHGTQAKPGETWEPNLIEP
jgi:hypothetical protein